MSGGKPNGDVESEHDATQDGLIMALAAAVQMLDDAAEQIRAITATLVAKRGIALLVE